MLKIKTFFQNIVKGNQFIFWSMFFLLVGGSFMIASAQMASNTGEISVLAKNIGKQLIIVAISLVIYFIAKSIKYFSYSIVLYKFAYFIFVALLFLPLLYSETDGAHAWIKLKLFYVQPSEFAKPVLVLLGAKLLGVDRKEKNVAYFRQFALAALIYVCIVLFIQHDFGSAIILLAISYIICLIPNYKELKKIHSILLWALLLCIIFALLLLSPIGTKLLEPYSSNYQVARFLAAANPFIDRYNTGYNLIMALVSFANGSWFGLGYTKSIHKYMNFPNPSTDYILPVIVEELGVVSFFAILLAYGFIIVPLMKYSIKAISVRTKIVMVGVFAYFVLHFCLNVGGVSGILPLTGVPLLLLSSGGSSTLSSTIALGIAQSEIIRYEGLVEK